VEPVLVSVPVAEDRVRRFGREARPEFGKPLGEFPGHGELLGMRIPYRSSANFRRVEFHDP
jgi:hypothetical protein